MNGRKYNQRLYSIPRIFPKAQNIEEQNIYSLFTKKIRRKQPNDITHHNNFVYQNSGEFKVNFSPKLPLHSVIYPTTKPR